MNRKYILATTSKLIASQLREVARILEAEEERSVRLFLNGPIGRRFQQQIDHYWAKLQWELDKPRREQEEKEKARRWIEQQARMEEENKLKHRCPICGRSLLEKYITGQETIHCCDCGMNITKDELIGEWDDSAYDVN